MPLNQSTDKTPSPKQKPRLQLAKIIQPYFNYVIIAQILLILAAGYWFVLRPQISEMRVNKDSFNKENVAKQAELSSLKQNIAELRILLESYNSLTEEEKEKINTLVLDRLELDGIFAEINKVLEVNGLIFGGIELQETAKDDTSIIRSRGNATSVSSIDDKQNQKLPKGVSAASLTVGAKGVSYSALKSLLSSLENNLRLFDVQSINYDSDKQEVELIVKTYYLSNGTN